MNQKGFTLVEILAAVAIISILSGMAMAAYTRYIDYSRQKAYKVMAKSASIAAEEYVMDNPGVAVETEEVTEGNTTKYVIKDSDATYITFDELIKGGYLNGAEDPVEKGKDCKGKVTIGVVESYEDGGLDQYIYDVDLCCSLEQNHFYYTFGEQNGKSKTIELFKRSKANCS